MDETETFSVFNVVASQQTHGHEERKKWYVWYQSPVTYPFFLNNDAESENRSFWLGLEIPALHGIRNHYVLPTIQQKIIALVGCHTKWEFP